ncbi:MAG: putative dehydrogenase [Planctomycetota bacterium]|jgi:predicted dehydrogenase
MPILTRRHFLQGTGSTALSLGIASQAMSQGVPAWQPNNEIRIACVGIHGRGGNHIKGFSRLKGVRIVAIVDVDSDVLAREKKKLADGKYGEKNEVDTYTDLRRVLDRDDIDAISVATPNHWHALQGIWACQAGKDVYLEKPVSHNVWEGGQIVKAARKYKRIVQTGTQCRSSHGIKQGIEYIQAGKLGDIELARGLCYKPRQSIGKVNGPQKVSDKIDYDMWLGPASQTKLLRRQLHYDWHWDFNTGNGDVGNQGIHQMDIARWALGRTELPTNTLSIGGRVGYDDDGNTPNTQIVFHEFAEGPPLLFEVRGLPRNTAAQKKGWSKNMDNFQGARIGVIVHCKNGYLRIPDYNRAIAFGTDGKEITRFEGSTNHYENFINSVRSRNIDDLKADIREGHLSSAMCHMGNVSHLLGKTHSKQELDAMAGKNPHTQEAWQRMHGHLVANGVDVDTEAGGVRMGPRLTMDPKTERFADDASNALLARNYRTGFVVPKEV